MNDSLTVRKIEARDVDVILAIQAACPEIAQWTKRDYDRVAAGEMPGWVAEEPKETMGFLVARLAGSEIEILNLAVRPEARRRGIGTSLVEAALAWGRESRAESAILEVRESNLAALRFYERHNFQVTGRRPRYYASPIEDALLLTAPLP